MVYLNKECVKISRFWDYHGIVQTNLFSSICNKYSILHIYFCWKNWCVYPESDIKFEQPCNGDLNFLHKYMYFLAVKKKLIFDEGKFTKNYIMYVNLNGIPCKPKSAKFVTGLKKPTQLYGFRVTVKVYSWIRLCIYSLG